MARPREFDVDEALRAAMEAFWERGYAATSMVDLLEATGLRKGSLYKAFRSKHALFARALERYLDDAYARMRDALEGAASAEEGLRRWLELVLGLCAGDGRRGCLALNSAVELGPHDEATAARLREHFGRVEELLARTIARGQERGELRSDRSPRHLAEVLFLLAEGMIARSKCTRTPGRTRRCAELALEIVTRTSNPWP